MRTFAAHQRATGGQSRSLERTLAVGAILASAALLTLWPMLWAPFFSDDAMNHSLAWLPWKELAEISYGNGRWWYLTTGRTAPVSMLSIAVAHGNFESIVAYKWYLLLLNLVAIGAFFAWLHRYAGSLTAAACGVVAVLMSVQFRDYHDAVLAFNGQMQWTAILGFLSLTALAAYLDRRNNWALATATVLYLLSLLTYEIAHAFIAVACLMIGSRLKTSRQIAVAAAPFIAASVLVVAVGLAGRWYGTHRLGFHTSADYVPSLDSFSVLATWLKQMLAALPFTYWAFRPSIGAWGINSGPFEAGALHPRLALIAGAYVLLLLVLRRSLSRDAESVVHSGQLPEQRIGMRWWAGEHWLALSGLALVGLPALAVAGSPKIQRELAWGNGYVPVYFEIFGIGTLVAAVALVIRRHYPARVSPASTFVRTAGVLVLALCLAANQGMNSAVAQAIERTWGPRQDIFYALVRSATFQQACGDLPAIILEPRPWASKETLGRALRLGLIFEGSEFAASAANLGEACAIAEGTLLGHAALGVLRVAPRVGHSPELELRQPALWATRPPSGGSFNALAPNTRIASSAVEGFVTTLERDAWGNDLTVFIQEQTRRPVTTFGGIRIVPCETCPP